MIVPVHNAERFLADAIESILGQDYAPLEVIVVDDGSTDGSGDVARRYSGVAVISQPNLGPAAARNAGLRRARGELVAFLDADDLMPASTLRLRVEYLVSHPNVDLVLGHQEIFFEPGVEPPRWLVGDQQGKLGGPVPMSMVVRGVVFDKVGVFDAEIEFGSEDTDWLMRARSAETRMAILDDVVVRRRIHSANLTSSGREVGSKLLDLVHRKLTRERGE